MNNVASPLVSIIIPVYNVESYLVQCLDSINNQIYENIECIMIIDGATDNSYNIAKEYCTTHPRFKVFYQENAGSGPARNNGISHSSGEYVCFVDPDDWVEPNYVNTLIQEQQKGNFDLVISQSIDRKIDAQNTIVSTSENNKPIFRYKTQKDCREQFPMIMFKYHYLDGPICKLFKISIIRSNNIVFPAYRRSQDMVFNFRYYNYITSISTISDHTYNIRYEYPPRLGRGRIFKDYNEIVAKIYLELSQQLKTWNIHSDYEELLHTWSFWYLYAFLYKCVESNISYDFIRIEPYRSIVNKARPTLLVQKIIRVLLVSRMYPVANIVMKLINKLR